MSLPAATDVGVVIGRFQVPTFHQGHRDLLNMVCSRHQRVLALLGSPAWRGGFDDPLDYQTRAMMFHEEYPQFITAPITDTQTDESWSEKVDELIKAHFPLSKVTLYTSRDGFLPHYSGRYSVVEVFEANKYSGTSVREATRALPLASTEFRAGAVYGILNNPGRMAPCVDGAVVRPTFAGIEVCLIKKPGEKLYRFPGGKLEPDDESLESAVNREVREETGLEVGTPIYVASGNLPDWRAIAAGITIHSSLFVLPYVFGAPKGGDDAAWAGFVLLDRLTSEDMEACHKSLLKKLQDWYFKQGKEILREQFVPADGLV
jgi:bifunctional NMN adenylyltransferase/nudix hydrolase